MKKWMLSILALLLIPAILPAHAAQPRLILEVRGIENLANSVVEAAEAVGHPIPRELITMQLYSAIGLFSDQGLQPNGTFRAIWMDGDSHERIALMLPLEGDVSAFLQNLGQAGWETGEEAGNGAFTLTAPGGHLMPWEAISALPFRNNKLIVAQNPSDARDAAAAFADAPAILPAEGVLALHLFPAYLLEQYAPLVDAMMEDALDDLSGDVAPVADMQKASVRFYMNLLRQVDSATLGLGVANGNVNFHTRVVPVAGTVLDQWTRSLQSPSSLLHAVNFSQALYVDAANMGDTSLIADLLIQYVDMFYTGFASAADVKPLKTAASRFPLFWAQFAGDAAVALLPPAEGYPVRAVQVASLNDAAVARGLVQENLQELLQCLLSLAADEEDAVAPDITLDSARTYRDVPIDSLTFSITPGEGAAPQNWPFGKMQFAVELAWINHALAVSIGDPSLTPALIDRVLDNSAAPLLSIPQWRKFYPHPDNDLLGMSHMDIFKLIRTYANYFARLTGEEVPADSIPEGPGYLSTLTYRDAGGLMGRSRFELSAVKEIVELAERSRAQAQAQQEALIQAMMESGEFPPALLMQNEWEFDDDEEFDSGDFDDEDDDGEEEDD